MRYSIHTGPADELTATLRQASADRRLRHETERADEAAEAARQVGETGAGYYEQIFYQAGEERDRVSVHRTSRDEVLKELADAETGWEHQGKPELARQAREARAAIEAGADEGRVGHIRYEVAPGDPGATDG